MDKAQREVGTGASVRIGITGTGEFPAYKIETAGGSTPKAFGGQLHQPFTEVELTEVNWSKATMTSAEVTDLLMSLRPKTAKPKRRV